MIAELVQHVVNGLIIGGGYALMGIGLTLIFGIMRVVNFAHGEFYMLGAFLLFSLFGALGINFFLASVVAIVAAGVAAVALIIGSHLFIQKTRAGKAMRATFQDGEMARLVGVDVDRVYTATFSFGAALAGAAGVLLGSVFWVYPAMGDQAAMKSFAVVIMGGLGDFLGALVGGLLLGVAESLGAAYISSGYKDAIGFVMIIVLLLFRPAGLFGRRDRLR